MELGIIAHTAQQCSYISTLTRQEQKQIQEKGFGGYNSMGLMRQVGPRDTVLNLKNNNNMLLGGLNMDHSNSNSSSVR